MVIFFGYEVSPNMIGIQDGYNKNFHIKCIEYYEKFDTWWLFWDMKMVILESCYVGGNDAYGITGIPSTVGGHGVVRRAGLGVSTKIVYPGSDREDA